MVEKCNNRSNKVNMIRLPRLCYAKDYAIKPMHFSGYPGKNSSLKSWIYSTSIISLVSHFHLFPLQNCIFSTLIFMRKNGRNHYKFSGKRFIMSSSTYVICDKSIQEWTKEILWKTAFKKFYLVHSYFYN